MSSERNTSLSFKIAASFALMTAVILELTGSFVPYWVQSGVNAVTVNGTIVRSYHGYSLWTKRRCDSSKCKIKETMEDCFHILRNNAYPFLDQTGNSPCTTEIYFPVKSEELGHLLIWGKKILMPCIILGLVGFVLYEMYVFMFVDCPKKNRRHVKRAALILSTVSGFGSCVCVSIFCFRSPSLPSGYHISWALAMPSMGGLLQLVFSSVEWYFERRNESDSLTEIDISVKNKTKRSERKIRFEDELSVIHSETELIPFEI